METNTTTLEAPSFVETIDLDYNVDDFVNPAETLSNRHEDLTVPFNLQSLNADSLSEFSTAFEDLERNTPEWHDDVIDSTNADDKSESQLAKSSEIDFDTKDDKPQTQTYVITEDGKIFPEDKVDKPEERANYELELKTEEQKQALAEIQDSSEKPVDVKILFKTGTDERGRIVKSYSVQTYIPLGEDENGRTRFELSSDIEVEIVEDEERENENTERAEPLQATDPNDNTQATEHDSHEHASDNSTKPENMALPTKPAPSRPSIDNQASPEYNEDPSDNNPWPQDNSNDKHNQPTNPTTPAPEDFPQGDEPNEAPLSTDTEHFADENPTIATAEDVSENNQENITAHTDEKPTVITKESPPPPQTEQIQEPLFNIPEVESTSPNDAQTETTTTKPQVKATQPPKAKPVVKHSTRKNVSQITSKSSGVSTIAESQVNQPAEIIQNTKHNSEISQIETKMPEASTADSLALSLDVDTSDQSTEVTNHQTNISEQNTKHPKVTEITPINQQNSSPLKPEVSKAPAEVTRGTSANNIETSDNSAENYQTTKVAPEVAKQSNTYEQRPERHAYEPSVYQDFVVEITTPTIDRVTAETRPSNKEKAQSVPKFTVTFENLNDTQDPTVSALQTPINDQSAEDQGDLEFTSSIPRGNKTKPNRQTFNPIGAMA